MKVEILATNDENFNIEVKKFGEQFVASDGERVVIGVTEEHAVEGLVELQEQNNSISNAISKIDKEFENLKKVIEDVSVETEIVERGPKAVPIENVRTSNSQSWFSGTGWDTSTGHKF